MTNADATQPLTTRAAFDEAVDRAHAAASAYYDTGAMIMDDATYDALVDAVAEAAAVHPDWDARGLLDAVAGGASSGGEVTHPQLMGSLEKAKDLEAVDRFASTVGGAVVVEPKLDGLAIRAEYDGGRLRLLATRGDGRTGEDVTSQAHLISGMPARIPHTGPVEIRGEVYMTDADFDASNGNRVAAGKPAFANPRNAVAGSLRASDRDYAVAMSFAAYDVYPEGALAPDHLATMAIVGGWGVNTAAALAGESELTAAEQVRSAIDALGERRDDLGYPIDGAVIKANVFADRARLGMATRAPRWAVAFKYAPNEATTTLKDIEVGVGRTGRISLRAVLEPVAVGGTTVTYATLHNPAFVEQQKLAIGQQVLVVRAGDVIPRVTAPIGDQPAGLTAWQTPADCPQCGEPWDTSSLLWRCTTPECSTVGRITYAVSRDCLDIMGISEAIATALVESGLVNDVADLYDLTADQLADLQLGTTSTGAARKVGTTVAAKIMTEIDKSKSQPLHRVVTAVGIRKTGRTMGRRLAAAFGSFDAIRAADEDALAQVDGIGPEKAKVIREDLAVLAPVIDRLAAAGLTMTAETATDGPAPLAGKTVVVTGAMTGPLAAYSRTEMNELIERLGGKSSGSVSAKTSYLVAAETGTSKAVKAAQLGVQVLTPEEFAALVGIA